uniref:Uncharacterized protein n=1 Tax=Peronospora matthiolae TaxID=2874970 RepID=A0AAV1U8T2_9STRA
MDPDASSVCNASRDLRVGFKSCCLHQCASAVIPIGYKCSDANVACGPRNEDASRSCNSLPTSLGDFQACCMKNC